MSLTEVERIVQNTLGIREWIDRQIAKGRKTEEIEKELPVAVMFITGQLTLADMQSTQQKPRARAKPSASRRKKQAPRVPLNERREQIVGAMRVASGPCTAGEIAQKIGAPKSAVHRILAGGNGFVVTEENHGRVPARYALSEHVTS